MVVCERPLGCLRRFTVTFSALLLNFAFTELLFSALLPKFVKKTFNVVQRITAFALMCSVSKLVLMKISYLLRK